MGRLHAHTLGGGIMPESCENCKYLKYESGKRFMCRWPPIYHQEWVSGYPSECWCGHWVEAQKTEAKSKILSQKV